MKQDNKDSVTKTKEAYKHIAQSYAHRNAKPNVNVTRMLDKFIRLLQGKDVIDIGCAEGRETKYLTEHGLNVTGCDLSEEFIEMARANCPTNKFMVADMRHLSENIGVFDGIWASASFLHIPKVDALSTLQGFRDILKEHGLLYLSVLEGDSDSLRANLEMHWPERHFSDYKEDELTDILKRAGFSTVDVEKTTRENGLVFLNYFCHISTS